jgi:hypothetical protein
MVTTNKKGVAGLDLIGRGVFFKLTAPQVSIADARQGFLDAGLDADVVRDKTKEAALRTAVSKTKGKSVGNKVRNNDDRVVFQLDEKTIENLGGGQEMLRFKPQISVVYHVSSNRVTVEALPDCNLTEDGLAEAEKTIGGLVLHWFDHYTTSEFKTVVQNFLDRIEGSVDFAGMTFIPEGETAKLAALKAVITKLDPQAVMHLLEMPKAPEAVAAVREAVENSVKGELEKIETLVATLKDEGREMTDTVFNNRIETLAGLGRRLEIFSGSLDADLRKAQNRVGAIKRVVQNFKVNGRAEDPLANYTDEQVDAMPDELKKMLGLH